MSHTDKTDPWVVKMHQYHREVHDHRDGACDLPASVHEGARWNRVGRCYYDHQWHHPIFRCSCWMCGFPNKIENRKTRREGKRYAREWNKEYE